MASINSTIDREVLFTRWVMEQVIFICNDKEKVLEESSSESLPEKSTLLISSSSACYALFWAYFQLTCLLWKKVLNGNGGLLFQKITYVTHITAELYMNRAHQVFRNALSTYLVPVLMFRISSCLVRWQ